MVNENYEQTSNSNSGFLINQDAYEEFELMMPDQLAILDSLSQESDLELDDYFMELELNFAE